MEFLFRSIQKREGVLYSDVFWFFLFFVFPQSQLTQIIIRESSVIYNFKAYPVVI